MPPRNQHLRTTQIVSNQNHERTLKPISFVAFFPVLRSYLKKCLPIAWTRAVGITRSGAMLYVLDVRSSHDWQPHETPNLSAILRKFLVISGFAIFLCPRSTSDLGFLECSRLWIFLTVPPCFPRMPSDSSGEFSCPSHARMRDQCTSLAPIGSFMEKH